MPRRDLTKKMTEREKRELKKKVKEDITREKKGGVKYAREQEIRSELSSIYPDLESDILRQRRSELYKKRMAKIERDQMTGLERDLEKKAREEELIKEEIYRNRNKRLYDRLIDEAVKNEEIENILNIGLDDINYLSSAERIDEEIRNEKREVERLESMMSGKEEEEEEEEVPRVKGKAPLAAIEALKRKREAAAKELQERTGAKPKAKPKPKPKPKASSSSSTEIVDEYLKMRDIAETATIPLSELERLTMMSEIERTDELFEYNPERATSDMTKFALILSKMSTPKDEIKIKSKIDDVFKDRLKDIEDEEILNEAYKTIESEYLEGKTTREERDTLMKIVKDKKKIVPVKVKISKKILTPKLRASLYEEDQRNIYKGDRNGNYIPTGTQLLRKYLYI